MKTQQAFSLQAVSCLGIGLGVVLCLCWPAYTEPPQRQASDQGKEADEADVSSSDMKSFWFIGTSNYHLRLEEPEGKIDRMLNDTFGNVLPRWERPTTFKDWGDDEKLWDLWAGYGHDINEKFSWSIYGGGGIGTIHNKDHYYPFAIPLKLEADFTRKSLMLGSSVSCYPWGRPEKIGPGLKNALKGARPMAEMNIGYNRQISIGDVTFNLPVLRDALHMKDVQKYNLFWTSPRVGLETPLTKRDSLDILTGYLFFHDHAAEFNGVLIEMLFRHRF